MAKMPAYNPNQVPNAAPASSRCGNTDPSGSRNSIVAGLTGRPLESIACAGN